MKQSSNPKTRKPAQPREGTSRQTRALAALAPERAPIFERSIAEMLASANRLGKRLRYYDDCNQPSGAWDRFIDSDLSLERVAAFLEAPLETDLRLEEQEEIRRPHLALFLAFLGLLSRTQDSLNQLTRRHLDFYYRQILGLQPKPALPDRAHLLFELASGAQQALVKSGMRVSAGPDPEGAERFYVVKRDLIVNRAQIVDIRSLRVEREITGFAEIRAAHRNDPGRLAVGLLEIALGEPFAGDPLPPFGRDGGSKVDVGLLREIENLIRFLDQALFLKRFELHDLLTLKGRREKDADEWAEINRLLEKAGLARDTKLRLKLSDPRDFEANLVAALGKVPDYAGLPEIDSVEDLYVHRARPDARDFIIRDLHFRDPLDFAAMMQIKARIDGDWEEIQRLLEVAGRRKNGQWTRSADMEPRSFDALLEAATAPDFSVLEHISNLDEYHDALVLVESYFFLSAPEIIFLLGVIFGGDSEQRVWAKADRLLTRAHREKHRARRRQILRRARLESGFVAMLQKGLGGSTDGETVEDAIDRLKPYLADADELAVLKSAAAGVGDPDWQRIEHIVETTWRNRAGLTEEAPRTETWLNLHPAADATAVQASSGTAEYPGWATFGRVPEELGSIQEPVLGWALSCPALSLSEGRRRIRLTLGFLEESFDRRILAAALGVAAEAPNPSLSPCHPLRVEVSTTEGLLELTSVETRLGTYGSSVDTGSPLSDSPCLVLTIELGPDFPSLAAPMAAASDTNPVIDTSWPVLRLRLRSLASSQNGRPRLDYNAFRGLRLTAVHLKVEVEGLRSLSLQNDDAPLDAAQPFEPFGFAPTVGSRLAVCHPELVTHALDSLAFRARWMGAPADLGKHYRNYGLQTTGFSARISMVDRGVDCPLVEQAQLFAGSTDFGEIRIPAVDTALPADMAYGRQLHDAFDAPPLRWNRYFQWQLNGPDFQHTAYPMVASAKALELTAALAGSGAPTLDTERFQVNPPYTPKIQSLEVDYSSSVEILIGQEAKNDGQDRIYHLHPFGYCDPRADEGSSREHSKTTPPNPLSVSLLPDYDQDGELYLGLQGVDRNSVVSILFQPVEGSADPSLDPADVRWSLLSGDRWHPLEPQQLLRDTTRRLTTSGILELDLEATQLGSRLPGELTWLRATVARGADSVCDTVAFHTQAVAADLEPDGVSPLHFSRPLAAGSISGLEQPIPEIAAVRQPYASDHGRMAEEENLFHTRVSERLRHKGRAVTPWDYEHLVLEHFPQVFKVKCLSADDPEQLGSITVVVVPDIRGRLHLDPFEPKAPLDLLQEVQAFLEYRMIDWGSVVVQNPEYRPVKARLAVRFKGNGNEGFYRRKLNEDLNRFLSPWAFGQGTDISFGGRIYAHSIVDFLDRRSYVDYITDLRLFCGDRFGVFRAARQDEDGSYFVAGDRPDTILVAARQHLIDLIPEVGSEESSWSGIGFMKLELDFTIA